MYRIYSNIQNLPVKPEKIITEDSNSGYEFFKAVSGEKDILCKNAGGKSNIFSIANRLRQKNLI